MQTLYKINSEDIYRQRWSSEEENFFLSGGEAGDTSYRDAIKLDFERLKGACQVEEDGKFIPQNWDKMQ